MPRYPALCILALSVIGSNTTYGQDPSKPVPPAKAKLEANPLKLEKRFQHLPLPPDWPTPEDLKPIPPVAIPDDPPPHEGAMIDIPLTIEPPDIVDIEVLEGLPGRPITGDHLVKPDGNVTLGFYGDVNLRGLTRRQAKMKIILHLQKHLNDEILGLVFYFEPDLEQAAMPEESGLPAVPGRRSPFQLELRPKSPELPEIVPPELFKKPVEPPKLEIPEALKSASARRSRVLIRSTDKPRADDLNTKNSRANRRIVRSAPKNELVRQDPAQPVLNVVPAVRPGAEGGLRAISPADSNRVFVEITSFNSKVYYVQGCIAVPGRLPFTGLDTVLDALNYAGGLLPSGDPHDIHLYRPARGGKPRTVFTIDYAALMKGEASANLQLFPSDRLVIGPKPVARQPDDQN